MMPIPGGGAMLLTGYRKEIFRAKCNPSFQSVHCFAHLNEDIREVLPYLNTVLGGSGYTDDPPSVTFQLHGRLITVHPIKIAINALGDEEEADKVLEWLKIQINETWANRNQIKPTYGVAPRPQILEILKLLPRTNCKKCGQPTCTVFSSLVAQGAKVPDDCPCIDSMKKEKLETYLARFTFLDGE
jgi:ArsR family metal-binding transcriptional regulator